MVKEDTKETKEEVVVDTNADANQPMSKAEFQELMDNYKEQNPKKYALKEKALKAKLATLK